MYANKPFSIARFADLLAVVVIELNKLFRHLVDQKLIPNYIELYFSIRGYSIMKGINKLPGYFCNIFCCMN